MSWGRNLIGDVKHVVSAVEGAVKKELGFADNKVNIAVASFETGIAKALGEVFEAAGKKVDEAGNALTALGLHIESSGHFGPDGSGSGTIKITSAVIPAAPIEVAAAAPAPAPSAAAAAAAAAAPAADPATAGAAPAGS
jgi:hypothetical protein